MADYVTAEPLFDFETGDFVIINGRPKLVTGKERIRNLINKTLHTQRNRYLIYKGTGYGINTDGITGKALTDNFIHSEMRREITEALLQIEGVISIDNFITERDGTKLIISFTAVTEYGSESMEEVFAA